MPVDPFSQYRPMDAAPSQPQSNNRPGSITDMYGREYDPVNGGWKTPQTATGWTADTRTNLMQQGADFSPYQNQLSGLLGNQANLQQQYQDLLKDPSKIQQTAGYKFDVEQGNQAINRSAAAKGALNSGNVLAELAKYGQGMASREYGNQLGYLQNAQQSAAGQTNQLANLMQNAQQFGVSSGLFRPTIYGTPIQTSNTQWATSSY